MSATTKLMRAMGSPRFDPMPPDQHAFYLGESETDVNRFVAWVHAGTIAIHHPSPGYDLRSPWVVDSEGKPQRIEHAARYFGWDPAYARRILRQAKAQGRVKTDETRRILLCGVVVPTALEDEEDLAHESKQKSEEKAKKKDCTRYVPSYILCEINKQNLEVRKRILAEEEAAADLHDRRVADAMAFLRNMRDQEQNTRFQRYALPERRKISDSKQKRDPNLPMTVQVKVVDLDAVPAAATDLVQSSEESAPEGTVQGADSGTVQGADSTLHPYSIETLDIEITTTAETEPPPTPDPVVVVVQKLAITPKRARSFIQECRICSPGCSTQDILGAIDQKEATIDKRKYPNFVPILLEHVPILLSAYRKAAEEWRIANTTICWSCKQPVFPDQERMRGAHAACWEREERAEMRTTSEE